MTTAQQILQQIAAQPGIRQVELCELLDIDAETIRNMLAPYIDTEISANEVVIYGGNRVIEYRMAPPKCGVDDLIYLAVSYIEKYGASLGSALAGPMGLEPKEAPTPILVSAVSMGKLVKVGERYELPDRAAKAAEEQREEIQRQRNPLEIGRKRSGDLVLKRGKRTIILSKSEERRVAHMFGVVP